MTTSSHSDDSRSGAARSETVPSDPVEPSFAQRLLYWLAPSPCLACDAPLWRTREALGLCPACRAGLRPFPEPSCRRCGRPEPGDGELCLGCPPPSYDRLLTRWLYAPPLDAVVTGLKFHRLDYLGEMLGRRLATELAARLTDCDAVVPVPLHWRRRLGRGYDQALLLARPIADAIERPLIRPLRRRRATPPQSRLPQDARRTNLADAFVPRRGSQPRDLCRGRHLLLIDDVCTTGATLDSAASALQRLGADKITALTLARAAPKGQKM